MQQITATELAAWLKDASREKPVLLDVREPWEHETCLIEGSQRMPMQTVPARFEELDSEAALVCICHHGGRSAQVANFLMQRGFTNVINLAGGVHGWAREVDPNMATY